MAQPLAAAPGAAYINITHRMQALYAVRGMWANGAPAGMLVPMLGPRIVERRAELNAAFFWVTPAQLEALQRDAESLAVGGRQIAQFLRRLREAARRAGWLAPPPSPFKPLVCPPCGMARAAFEKHVMDCLYEVIAYSQESVYTT